MNSPTRVILMACGSFNPVTNMHLRMFEIARDALHKTGRYQVIGAIISPVSDAYSKKDLVPAPHRCAMLKLALKTTDWIRLDPWESEQDVWSTTAKVLKHHREKLDATYNTSQPDTPTKRRKLDSADGCNSEYSHPISQDGPVHLKLLCGADLLESFGVPGLWKDKDIEEMLTRYGLVCISRAGTNPEKFIYENDILAKYQNSILMVTEWINNEISATKIRRALRRGESVKYLMQDSVIDYIKTHNLYGASDNKIMNQFTPSPNRDDEYQPPHDFDHDPPPPPPHSNGPLISNDLLSPTTRVTYKTVHDSYVSRSVDSDTTTTSSRLGHRSYRRHRELNLDEEHRRKDYRRDSSLDSLDSERSFPRSPHSPTIHVRKRVTCIGADLTGLVRRVRGIRVTMTPETCV